jgi:anti-anti-sigma regulatory factor
MEMHAYAMQMPATCRPYMNVDKNDPAITINVGEDLDLRLRDTFLQVVGCAQRNVASRIVVDLSKTRRIFDSGLAMLMLLNARAWRLSSKIRIVNYRPELQRRLVDGLNPDIFNLDQLYQE